MSARRGIVYAIITRHDRTGRVGVGYVGQTRQTLDERLSQHRERQPWSDRIEYAVIVDQGVWTDRQLDRVEITAIRKGVMVPGVTGRRRQRPWYNIDHNRDNPRRIMPWDAAKWRQDRTPGWKPARPPRAPRVSKRRGGRWGWFGTWLGLTVAAYVSLGSLLDGDVRLVAAAAAATLPFGAAWWVRKQ